MFKKVLFFISLILFFACAENNLPANCLRQFPVSLSTDLNNPQLINVQTPGGFAHLTGGAKGIFLFNINGSEFVAFDKLCPQNDCNSPMTFEKGTVLKCSCDESEYSVHFGGAPQTDDFECPARQYKVTKSGSSIRISNF
ncbi:phosphoribosylaminoimidazole carboxylase [Polaribacter sp. BM10]|nr:phosphoribosylaminoimidazole carboxylase [Polaribacter sp. BM10]